MSKSFLKKLMIITIVCTVSVVMIVMMDRPSDAQNTKKKSGLNFQVPEDWPIEKRGGILAPIPTEEYFLIKFKATEEEFQAIKADLASKFEELQFSIKDMEVHFVKEIQETQLQAESQGNGGDDIADILESLASLKSEIGRLDRKITNKVAGMKGRFEDVAVTTKFIEKKIEGLQTQIYRLDEEIDYVADKQEGSY